MRRDEEQVKWVRSFYKLMQTLIAFVKQYHTKGVQWNSQGVDAAEAIRQVASEESSNKTAAPPAPPLPSASGPPPPPPPPPPGFASAPSVKKAPAADMGAVFADLQRGEAITSGLKKVDSSQMTHKNPTLRAGAVVPERSNSSSSLGRSTSPGVPPGKKPKPESLRTKKPPRMELDGNKWIIVCDNMKH
jgi:adenylyl cyclase-associated protein